MHGIRTTAIQVYKLIKQQVQLHLAHLTQVGMYVLLHEHSFNGLFIKIWLRWKLDTFLLYLRNTGPPHCTACCSINIRCELRLANLIYILHNVHSKKCMAAHLAQYVVYIVKKRTSQASCSFFSLWTKKQ